MNLPHFGHSLTVIIINEFYCNEQIQNSIFIYRSVYKSEVFIISFIKIININRKLEILYYTNEEILLVWLKEWTNALKERWLNQIKWNNIFVITNIFINKQMTKVLCISDVEISNYYSTNKIYQQRIYY